MTLLDRILTHKWWLGVSGLFAVVAVIVAVALDDEEPKPAAPVTEGSTVQEVADGDCNAQGSDIAITCVPAKPEPTAEGLEFFRQTVEPIDEGVSAFALPADAPLEDFPQTGNSGFCSEEQVAWLRRHGDEAAFTSIIRIRNAGTTGANLNLSDLRIEELESEPAEPVLWFDCPSAGNDDGVEVDIDLDRQGDVKVWYPDRDESVPGSAFSFSLAPGEGGWLLTNALREQAGTSYSGRLVVTARYGDAEQDVALRLIGEEDTFHLPGDGHQDTAKIMASDDPAAYPFQCGWLGEIGESAGCTVEQIRERLRG
ncbi:hypothetical protein OHA21_25550 [Actinoplanes sp. NBC_00393]|uniref:hypothetical protein n=1 Tax=Actinoplanes sp. NBC_00393 TaxID=2975953 RepID=UPI002E1FE008